MKTQATPKTASAKKTGTAPKKTPRSKAPVSMTSNGNGKADVVTDARPPQKEEIARMAYKIWQEQGCPEGREEEHWRQAEQCVAQGDPCVFTL